VSPRQRGHGAQIGQDEQDQIVSDDSERDHAIEPARDDHIALVEKRQERSDDERDHPTSAEHRRPARAPSQIDEEAPHTQRDSNPCSNRAK
jgi:hypothetical protein